MSTSVGGPGWRQGPDGRWYPPPPVQPPPPGHRRPPGHPPIPAQRGGPPFIPQQRPPYPGPPFPAPPPPGYPPLAFSGAPPPPPPPRGGSGKVIAIVAGAALSVVVLTGLALSWAVSEIAGTVGLPAGEGCTAVDTAAIDAALGGRYEVVQLGGVAGLAAPILDGRVLPDATLTCWATEPAGRQARIARYEGSDARARFAAERTTAMGTTEDRGGGLAVSSAGYFNKDVTAADEAFCTSGDVLGFAGVLVRRGNVLIYVSTTAAGQGAGAAPDVQIPADGSATSGLTLGTDDANCDLALRLAPNVS